MSNTNKPSSKPKIAIIGGGIIGMTMARELSTEYQVSLFDAQLIGQEASWAGGGILSPLYFWRYQDTVLRLTQNVRADYQLLSQQLKEETHLDIEFMPCKLNILDELSTSELARIKQQDFYSTELKHSGQGDYISADVAQIRNPRLLKAMKQSLIQRKVGIFENHAIQLRVSNKRQVQIEGEQDFDYVILSSGAWINSLLKQLDLNLDVYPIRGQILAYQFDKLPITDVWMRNGVYLIPRQDNVLLVGSTLEDVGFDQSITEQAKISLLTEAEQFCPEIKQATLIKQWAGLRPASKDNIPTIATVPGYDNLWVNAGHFRYGITMALNSAKIMRNLLETGEYPDQFKQDAQKLSF